jgi:hypothetical protein
MSAVRDRVAAVDALHQSQGYVSTRTVSYDLSKPPTYDIKVEDHAHCRDCHQVWPCRTHRALHADKAAS